MAEFFDQGDCIDGHRVLVTARRLDFKGYYTSPTGFKGVKYNGSRNCKSVIETPLSEEDKEAAIKKKKGVHYTQEDELNCDKLYFVAETNRSLNCFKVTMMSGRHECKEGKPDCRVYAEIQTPFEHIVNAAMKKLEESKQNHLSFQK